MDKDLATLLTLLLTTHQLEHCDHQIQVYYRVHLSLLHTHTLTHTHTHLFVLPFVPHTHSLLLSSYLTLLSFLLSYLFLPLSFPLLSLPSLSLPLFPLSEC